MFFPVIPVGDKKKRGRQIPRIDTIIVNFNTFKVSLKTHIKCEYSTSVTTITHFECKNVLSWNQNLKI